MVVETFGEAYPELVQNQANIIEIVTEEEQAFSTMLDRGIKYFDEEIKQSEGSGKKAVTGDKAFYLYDTLGFPIDLTELMAEEAGMTVDVPGFEAEMENQKQRSRQARLTSKGVAGGQRLEMIAEQTAWLADEGIAVTDDSFKYKLEEQLEARVEAIFTLEEGFLKEGQAAAEGSAVGLVLDRSSFYAEAGGQDADLGVISLEGGGELVVDDVQVYGGYVLHSGVVAEGGSVTVGSPVRCRVDYSRRSDVAPNHSMTHVLNAALREVLGDGCDQRGSQCSSEKLRFDFSHKKAVTAAQLRDVEAYVRDTIDKAIPVSAEVMSLEDAKAIPGVRAMFGEVYPDPVRVVKVGDECLDVDSVEFCGGTHIENTAEAEAFVLTEETAVAKGVRRITALTRGAAKKAMEEGAKLEARTTTLESINADETPDLDKQAGALRKDLDAAEFSAALKSDLRARIESVQKKGIDAKKRLLAGRVDRCLNTVTADVEQALADGRRALVLNLDIGADSKASQKVIKAVQKIAPELAFMGVSEEEAGSGGKALCFAIVPKALAAETGLKANEWLKEVLDAVGGRGGGKPNSAQGQVPSCEDVEAVIAKAESFVKSAVVVA